MKRSLHSAVDVVRRMSQQSTNHLHHHHHQQQRHDSPNQKYQLHGSQTQKHQQHGSPNEKQQQQQIRKGATNRLFWLLMVSSVAFPCFLLAWLKQLVVLEPTEMLPVAPLPKSFSKFLMNANKTKTLSSSQTLNDHKLKNASSFPGKNNSSPPIVHQVPIPQGLDVNNASTWLIVQRDPRYKHINISVLVQFLQEFDPNASMIATERQIHLEAEQLRLAQESFLSMLAPGLKNNLSLSNMNSKHCLQQQQQSGSNVTDPLSRGERANAVLPPNIDSLTRLHELGIPVCWLDPSIQARIAPWSKIADKYGDSPRILGLDQCHAFQKAIPNLQDRWLVVAGLFHSGTNFFFELLTEYCDMRPRIIVNPTITTTTDSTNNSSQQLRFRLQRTSLEKRQGIAWQVTWGKHNPAHVRDTYTCKSIPGKVTVPDVAKSHQLPIVMIRHPYDWMESMCHQPYGVAFFVRRGKKKSCPSMFTHVIGTNVSIKVGVQYGSGIKRYANIARLYNEWYQDYVSKFNHPRLVVRLEDVIHHPKVMVQQVCDCAGGVFRWTTSVKTATPTTTSNNNNRSSDILLAATSVAKLLGSAKAGLKGHNTSRTSGFLHAWTEPELKRVSQDNKDFAKMVLDSGLMKTFHYQL